MYIDNGHAHAVSRPVLLRAASSGGSGRRPATQEARLAIFAEAVEMLARESARPITLEDVARRLATSPRQLQRVFTDHAGIGFRSYLRRLRMSNAADLLAGTDLPVRDIAEAVGYSDASQFAKAFKRLYGLSPTRYRSTREERSGRVGPRTSSYPAPLTGSGPRQGGDDT